jgi:hypothetical protein
LSVENAALKSAWILKNYGDLEDDLPRSAKLGPLELGWVPLIRPSV